MTTEYEDQPVYRKRFPDYIALFSRRRMLLILPTVAISAGAVALSLVLSPVYLSVATVLIEEPEVPRDLIQSTVTSYATRRLQTIRQKVMATESLRNLIQENNLYVEDRKTKPLISIIERFRSDLSLEMVNANVTDPRSGSRRSAAIAFQLGYESSNPATAQKITNELVSLYLSENLRGRQIAVKETVRFLSNQSKGLADRIDELEAKLSRFKAENSGSLPGQLNANHQIISDLKTKILRVEVQISNIENTQALLRSQLAQIQEYPETRTTQRETSASQRENRLEALNAKLEKFRTLYTSRHPDIIRLEREVSALMGATSKEENQRVLKNKLQAARINLSQLEKSLGQDHPDVELAREKIVNLNTRANSTTLSEELDAVPSRERNPVYLQLTGELENFKINMKSLHEQRLLLIDQLKIYESRVLGTPEIERLYLTLIRDYENTQIRYRDIKDKLIEAELAKSLEAERKSERFTLIEPPQLPSKPIKPQKILIIIFGILGGFASGTILVLVRDTFDNAIYGARQLATVTGKMPLISIPIVQTRADSLKKIGISLFLCVFVFGGILSMAVIAHLYWRPLDVLWYSAISKYGL